MSLDEFVAIVERKRSEPNKHTTYCQTGARPYDREHGFRDCWLDKDGNSFSEGEFS